MPAVPNLRSPYAKVGRLVYFGRMLDKIRLHAAGKLPPEYVANLGDQKTPTFFDARICRFLGVPFADITSRTLQGGSDEEILAWVESRGTKRTDEECEIWSTFLVKRGWRDAGSTFLAQRIADFGLAGQPISTMFELIEFDEGRDPARDRPWEKV